MRRKINCQAELDFRPSNLSITNEYYEKYQAVSTLLDENPKVIDLVHKDIKDALESETSDDGHGGTFKYTSDTTLRILMCQIIEGLSLRETVIRIDDSHYLRRFVRVYTGPMMDFTTLCKLKNCISADTWNKVNEALTGYAVKERLIDGEKLRMDTTVVETNIHWPTDSSLLWDTYRTLARLIEQARQLDPSAVGHHRLQTRKVKKLYTKISRKASKKPGSQETLKPFYERLIELVTSLCQWAEQVRQNLEHNRRKTLCGGIKESLGNISQEIAHYYKLGFRVIDQASRRVLDAEHVPNEERGL